MPRKKKQVFKPLNIISLPNFAIAPLDNNSLPGMSTEDARVENQINTNVTLIADNRTLVNNPQEIPIQGLGETPLETSINDTESIELESVLPRYWRDGFGEIIGPMDRPVTTVQTEEEIIDSDTLLNWYDEDVDSYKIEGWNLILKNKIDKAKAFFKKKRDDCRETFLKDIAKTNNILPLDAGEELLYRHILPEPKKITEKIVNMTERVNKYTLEKLKDTLEIFSKTLDSNDYISTIDLTKEKWFGFNVNMDLIELWELVEIPLKYCRIYSEEEVKKEDISELLGFISEICVHTRSKQALFYVKYFAEGSRIPSGRNKKGFSEYKRTFSKVLDTNDKKSYCSVSKMLSCVLNVRCAYKNRYNFKGLESGNLTLREGDDNDELEHEKKNKIKEIDKDFKEKVESFRERGIPWLKTGEIQ